MIWLQKFIAFWSRAWKLDTCHQQDTMVSFPILKIYPGIIILAMNRLINFGESLGDTFSDIEITKDSVTLGERELNIDNCSFTFPERGYYRRSNERSVLPHAIGCQPPSFNWGMGGYGSVLLGEQLIMKIFLLYCCQWNHATGIGLNIYHQTWKNNMDIPKLLKNLYLRKELWMTVMLTATYFIRPVILHMILKIYKVEHSSDVTTNQ